jgi:hypothetical protein
MKAALTRSKLYVLAVAGTLVAVAAGVSYGAIPSATGVISACKSPAGAIKVIDKEAGELCPGPNQHLEWNTQGPTGPTGPAGPAGPPGPSDGYVEIVSESAIPGTGQPKTVATLSLPAGKYVLFAKGHFLVASATGSCTLTGPQGDDSAIAYQPTADAAFENFSLMVPAEYSAGGDATVTCLSLGGLEVRQIKLTAIKVANLTAPGSWTADQSEPPTWGQETTP